MKKFIFLICLMLFSIVALAGPVAGDGLLGSSGYSAVSMDGLLGNGTTAVDVGNTTSPEAITASYANTKTKSATVIEKAKAGAGVIYTAGLDSLNRSKRLPLTEVGWR